MGSVRREVWKQIDVRNAMDEVLASVGTAEARADDSRAGFQLVVNNACLFSANPLKGGPANINLRL